MFYENFVYFLTSLYTKRPISFQDTYVQGFYANFLSVVIAKDDQLGS